ncbi:MAG: histidine kinase [Candidatus Eisenbacteria bacterium]|uniref:Histidine kinase n=1 Tax=Eiseniibacteriota bacterium TaxID=2212470 RepID=A0A956SEK2_UNCEI|nr:histidine kinase [Candidatus Eisenbacteria bacterium]MCB9465519.1 histidine kinase [Candidatus Eisenbacteria bacterium]
MAEPIDVPKLVHDLRNPLNSISMTAELAKLQLMQGEAAEAVAGNLDAIIRICRSCSTQLDEVSRAAKASGSSQDQGK